MGLDDIRLLVFGGILLGLTETLDEMEVDVSTSESSASARMHQLHELRLAQIYIKGARRNNRNEKQGDQQDNSRMEPDSTRHRQCNTDAITNDTVVGLQLTQKLVDLNTTVEKSAKGLAAFSIGLCLDNETKTRAR